MQAVYSGPSRELRVSIHQYYNEVMLNKIMLLREQHILLPEPLSYSGPLILSRRF